MSQDAIACYRPPALAARYARAKAQRSASPVTPADIQELRRRMYQEVRRRLYQAATDRRPTDWQLITVELGNHLRASAYARYSIEPPTVNTRAFQVYQDPWALGPG